MCQRLTTRDDEAAQFLGGIKQCKAVWRGPLPPADGEVYSLAVRGVSRGDFPLGKISPVRAVADAAACAISCMAHQMKAKTTTRMCDGPAVRGWGMKPREEGEITWRV